MVQAYLLRVTATCLMIFILAGPCRAESGLLLKQFSARYGSITCMATNQNFRMDASELRVFLKPPFKQMDMYNMSSKARFTCDIGLIGKDTDWRLMTASQKKAGAKEEVVSKGEDILQQYKLNRYLIILRFPKKQDLPKLDFWTTREKDFPQTLNSACCILTGLPEGYGFPVKMYQYQDKEDRSGKIYHVHFKVLDTTKVTKQDFPATTFAQPQGFHPVKDLMELMVSSEQAE
jgi:hypothetical protein